MKKFLGAIGGRKFIVALLALISVVVAATTGYEIPETMMTTIATILGTYLVGQGLADGLSGGKTATTTPDADG